MLTVLKIMGLIFEQFSNLLTDEFFWIILLVVIAVYRKNSDIEAKMLGSSYELHYKVAGSLFVGMAAGLIGSLIVMLMGICIEDYTRSGGGSLIEGITYIWVVAILLSLINPRYLCFSYAGGIIALMSLVFGFPSVNVPGLMALIGVLHLVESLLIWMDGSSYSVPLFLRRKDGKTIGGYMMNKIWPIPLVAFAVILGNETGGVSIGGVIDMPGWWPFLKHTAAGSSQGLAYLPLVVPVVLGYGDMAVTRTPQQKCRSSALRLASYSLVLIILSVIASKLRLFAFAAAIFAPAAHEMLIQYGVKEEEEGKPYFTNKETGLRVLYVEKDSIAGKMGIVPGDTILSINGMALLSGKQLAEFLAARPVFIWVEFEKYEGKAVTAEYSDYRNRIGDLGILVVPHNAELYYEINRGSSLAKRLIKRFYSNRNRGIGM
ncbi:MAG TPA: PDZ domain-containing protein [Clostridia bacterium]|nr:PDZ domain-containing protein [Bacillota bacterium]HRS21229.1 PDZ domain-containing protein [Clostridia bacterium]